MTRRDEERLWTRYNAATPRRRSYDDRDGMSVLTLALLCVFGLFCWAGLALLLIGGV